MRFLRLLPLPVLLVAVLFVAGCGGGGGGSSSNEVPADAVATVGSDTITKAQFNDLLAGAKRSYKARKITFPKVGTTQYKTLQDTAIQYLVQESELRQKGAEIGVKVTPADVTKSLKQLKQSAFGGSEAKYQKQLKAQGLTEAQVRQDLFAQLLSNKIYAKVTAKVKVSAADVKSYYTTHKSTYTTQASRDVRHILVNSKTLAAKLETQLEGGASFGTLAKKYSKDTGSAKNGGKLTISKGQTVAPFDKVAFSLKTGATSPPVHTQYGWHIIQALSDVKPESQTPLASVKDSIEQQLLTTKKQTAVQKWLARMKSQFAKQIAYQAGYQPSSTATTDTTTTG
jgi:foldase protein PrsA